MLDAMTDRPEASATVAFPRGRTPLHAMVASAGVERVRGTDYVWNGLRRGTTPFVVVQHTLAGAGHLTYGGQHRILAPGETMVLTIPHDHLYASDARLEWHFFYLVLSGLEVVRLARAAQLAAGPVLTPGRHALDRLAGCCAAVLDGGAGTPGEASAIAYGAMMALYDEVAGGKEASPLTGEPDWLAAITALIRHAPEDRLDVDRLARRAGLSRAHFVRQFTRWTGVGPAEFVLSTRMARAARLLQGGGMSIGAVAQACGFADPNYFAKAFRRAFDVSPSEFRRSGLYTAPDRRV